MRAVLRLPAAQETFISMGPDFQRSLQSSLTGTPVASLKPLLRSMALIQTSFHIRVMDPAKNDRDVLLLSSLESRKDSRCVLGKFMHDLSR
ncbi:hypothetical protein E4U55_007842 [Claviceps digitariae]|nr:hypothetical protein E4U55_007842 [Claviceps digitariae]